MNDNEFTEFTAKLVIVAETYGKEIKEGVFNIYFDALSDITLEMATFALSSAVKSLKWFPKPSELRELAIQKNSVAADEAWSEVLRLKNEFCGTGNTPVFSSTLVERACQSVGGLNGIWMGGIEQEGYARNAFINAYKGLAGREHHDLMIGAPTREEAKRIIDAVNRGGK